MKWSFSDATTLRERREEQRYVLWCRIFEKSATPALVSISHIVHLAGMAIFSLFQVGMIKLLMTVFLIV